MPQYLALTYTADVDWWAPEQADGLADYRRFAVDHADRIRASAVLHPTSTATVVRVQGARGGDVITTDGPYAETKEALTGYYLLEADDLDAAGEAVDALTASLAGQATAPERLHRQRRRDALREQAHAVRAEP